MRAGVWVTDGWNLLLTPDDASFTISELESEGDYLGCLNAIGKIPEIPKAVVTNFTPLGDASGYLPQKAAPLIENGFRCLTECYIGDDPNTTPPKQDFVATRQLGWPDSQPVFGVYNAPLSSFSEWMQGGWSIYLGEYVL